MKVKRSWIFDKLGETAQVTVIMPVFNQQAVIRQNLESLIESLALPARIILLDDASTDGTSQEILKSFEVLKRKNSVASLELHVLAYPCYETSCDAYGISLAKTKIVIEVQADMKIVDPGFDARLVDGMRENPDIFALSGRGVEPIGPVLESYNQTAGSDRSRGGTLTSHILTVLTARIISTIRRPRHAPTRETHVASLDFPVGDSGIFPTWDQFRNSGSAGRLGVLIESRISEVSQRRKIWIGDTIMRGPIVLDREKYLLLGGLDSNSFFQGYDDHDLMLRARKAGYAVGFTPVEFCSPLSDGTTRKPRTLSTDIGIIRMLARIQRHRKKSFLFQAAWGLVTLPKSRFEMRSF